MPPEKWQGLDRSFVDNADYDDYDDDDYHHCTVICDYAE